MKFAVVILFILLLNWTVLPAPSNFHQYHTSLTRIDYRSDDKNVEITVQVFVHDLEIVLEKFAKKRVDFDKSSETDAIIQKYLEENFVLKNQSDEKLKLKWVGKELSADMAMIYLETASDKSIENFKLQNTIFFESFPEQTNLVNVRLVNKKIDLLYKTGDKTKTIAENPETK